MTLIAGILNKHTPVLIGDLLITSNFKPDEDVFIPTVLNGKIDFDGNNYPVELRQKIYVISDNLIVGLAGDVQQMTRLLIKIKTEFLNQIVDDTVLSFFLKNIDTGEFDKIAYLIIAAFKNKELYDFKKYEYGIWKKSVDTLNGEIYAIGSGASRFIEEANRFIGIDKMQSPSLAWDSLALPQSTITNMLALESFNQRSIQKLWGAGFEIIYFEGKFKKMDNNAHIIWYGTFNEKLEINFHPILINKYKYHNGNLGILSSNGNNFNGIAIQGIDCNIQKGETINFPDLEWKSLTISNSFFAVMPNKKFATLNIFLHSKDELSDVILDLDEDGHLLISIKPELEERVRILILEKNGSV